MSGAWKTRGLNRLVFHRDLGTVAAKVAQSRSKAQQGSLQSSADSSDVQLVGRKSWPDNGGTIICSFAWYAKRGLTLVTELR